MNTNYTAIGLYDTDHHYIPFLVYLTKSDAHALLA
jgi:hypothetical protein